MTPPPLVRTTPASDVVVARIRSRIDDLTKPRREQTTQWVLEAGADHLVRRVVTVENPPLLVQLGQGIAGSTGGRSGSGPSSRPPGGLDATDCLRTIGIEARQWAALVLADLATAALPGLRVSVRAERLSDALAVIRLYAPELDREDALGIDRDVTHWWARARVVTTWDSPPMRPYVPCSRCLERGTLRVVTDPLAVVCLACSSAWDGMSVDELGDHLRIMLAASIAERDTLTGPASLRETAPSA